VEPISYKRNGRELGNAAAAAAICGITWESYQWYVRRGKPENNPAPGHIYVDPDTQQRMYALKDVREWQRNRKGRGNWGGDGAAARHKHGPDDLSWCPVCRHRKGVREDGKVREHATPRRGDAAGERCPGSGENPTPPPIITADEDPTDALVETAAEP
jgi:hypothetical protein